MDIADFEKQEFLMAHNKVRHHFDELFFVWDSGESVDRDTVTVHGLNTFHYRSPEPPRLKS
ncbi:hypothetical protein U1Q18_031715 [Sarracenia purpurea var. burkii]